MPILRKKKESESEVKISSASEFWDIWTSSDELKRKELIQTLTVFDLIPDPFMRVAVLGLVNSYLVDLYNYMEDRMLYLMRSVEQKGAVAKYGSSEPEDSVSQVQP